MELCCVLFVSLRGKLAPYVPNVSLLCLFCVLEHVVSALGKKRAMMLTEHGKMTAGHAWQNCGKVGSCPEL